jgi:hypothetical protein
MAMIRLDWRRIITQGLKEAIFSGMEITKNMKHSVFLYFLVLIYSISRVVKAFKYNSGDWQISEYRKNVLTTKFLIKSWIDFFTSYIFIFPAKICQKANTLWRSVHAYSQRLHRKIVFIGKNDFYSKIYYASFIVARISSCHLFPVGV